MSDTRRRSALAHRQPLRGEGGAARLNERPFEGKLVLRGNLDRIGPAVAKVLGAPLPAAVLQTASTARATTIWLGPDEWLVVTAAGAEAALASDLATALAGLHAQVVDVTDYYTTIELAGPRSREMLMKVATVDFHPRHFRKGMGVATNVGRTVPWLHQIRDDAEPEGPAFDLIIRISMADYLWCLLAEAGHEWGLPELEPRGRVKLHLPHFDGAAGGTPH